MPKSCAPISETPMRKVDRLSAAYGEHRALDRVSIEARSREIVVILGANGPGKSTLLKAIAGVVPTLPGAAVAFAGRDIRGLQAHEIVEAGIALVPEGRGIFGEFSVEENLSLGAYP